MTKGFVTLGAEIGALVSDKQESYGDSYGKSGKVLELLYPEGVKPEQFGDLLAVARVIDKLFRVATKKGAFGESPWRDIAGYALLGIAKDEKPVGVMEAQRIRSQELLDSIPSFYDFAKDLVVPDPDLDLMGLRIIRNDERCCDHPERGICLGEKTERIGPTTEDIEGVSR